MERVTGYLAADGTFFGQEDECIRYEQERLRFFALGQRTQYLLEPSTTGAKPDISKIRPEIAEHMEMAGACEMESPLILLLRHIRELLNNEEDHDQLESLVEILRYTLDGKCLGRDKSNRLSYLFGQPCSPSIRSFCIGHCTM